MTILDPKVHYSGVYEWQIKHGTRVKCFGKIPIPIGLYIIIFYDILNCEKQSVAVQFTVYVYASFHSHFSSDVTWNQDFLHVCVLCIQYIAQARSYENMSDVMTWLWRKQKTTLLLFDVTMEVSVKWSIIYSKKERNQQFMVQGLWPITKIK